MPASQQKQPREIGPKTITVQLPALHVPIGNPLEPEDFGAVTINTAPRAGQLWKITSCYFSFSAAEQGSTAAQGLASQHTFEIELLVGQKTVAKQVFESTGPTRVQEEENEHAGKWPLLGNLESFSPLTVYPGESLEIVYKLYGGEFANLGPEQQNGVLNLTYTLVA